MRSRELARLVSAQICLHACMAGMRMASPLLALREGYSPLAVGVLLALFSLTQVVLALPCGRYADRHALENQLVSERAPLAQLRTSPVSEAARCHKPG